MEHQGFQIGAGDVLLFVRHALEALEDDLQLLVSQLVAHGFQFLPQGVLAGVLAKDHSILRNAHLGGIHNLVGEGIGQDAVLMDAGLMSEGVGANNGLAGRDSHAGDGAQELAGTVNLLGIDAGIRVIEGSPGPEVHNDLLQAGVPGPLADAREFATAIPRSLWQWVEISTFSMPSTCSRR